MARNGKVYSELLEEDKNTLKVKNNIENVRKRAFVFTKKAQTKSLSSVRERD
jgi:hypothetical protein